MTRQRKLCTTPSAHSFPTALRPVIIFSSSSGVRIPTFVRAFEYAIDPRISASCILWSYLSDWLNACILIRDQTRIPRDSKMNEQGIGLASEAASPELLFRRFLGHFERWIRVSERTRKKLIEISEIRRRTRFDWIASPQSALTSLASLGAHSSYRSAVHLFLVLSLPASNYHPSRPHSFLRSG